jgi:hypothetical protein
MQDLLRFLGHVLAGVTMGYIAAVIGFFIGQFYRDVFKKPKQFMGPAVISVLAFGAGFYVLGVVMLGNWPFFIAATLAFIWGTRPMFTIAD